MQKARNGLPPSGLTHMDLVRPQDLCDTLEIQSVLEAFAARLAAQRGVTSAQSDRLRQYVAAMEEIAVAFGTVSSELLDQYVNMSRRFHQLMSWPSAQFSSGRSAMSSSAPTRLSSRER